MSTISKKQYTVEFREEAVKLVTEQGYSQAEAGKRLGIASANISRWIKESSHPISKQKQKKVMSEEQKELEELRKEVKRLRMEREILKKAAAFFANEKN
jgi:transposase